MVTVISFGTQTNIIYIKGITEICDDGFIFTNIIVQQYTQPFDCHSKKLYNVRH